MERPEKPTRRWFLKGLAATAGAGAAAHFLREKDHSGESPSKDANPSGVERLPHVGGLGMRTILEEQLRSGEKPAFGPREQMAVNVSWIQRMKNPAFVESLKAANARISSRIEPSHSEMYIDRIRKIFEEERVPEKLLYIAFSESWFTIRDGRGNLMRSATGATGPFQFQEETGKEYGLVEKDKKGKVIRDDRGDPIKSARAAARYLRRFAEAFKRKGTPEEEAWDFAVLSYNGSYAQTYLRNDANPSLAGFREFITASMQNKLEEARSDRSRKVQPRETLKSLSVKYALSERALMEANPRVDWRRLVAHRTEVHIPGIGNAPLFRTAQGGDTVISLAQKIGTSEKELREINPNIAGNAPLQGREIRVPKNSSAFANYILQQNLHALRGYIENVDYLAKTKAIIHAVEHHDLGSRVPLPRRRPPFDTTE